MSNARRSNIELYRIVVMLFIIAHHYIVNSGVTLKIYELDLLKKLYLFAFGAWGKTGINCFILITGYFMCKHTISIKKWLDFLLQIVFYCSVITLIFVITGYGTLSLKDILDALTPLRLIDGNFTSCYLILYLFIPYINILIQNMNEKQYLRLLISCLIIFTLFASIPFVKFNINYVFWFIVVYLIGAYIRLYPKKIYENWKLWLIITLFSMIVSVTISFAFFKYMGYYFLLTDSNAINAVLVSISSFILFINLPVKNSKLINTMAKSTFGVLLIHANSVIMRRWLWVDTLHNADVCSTNFVFLHSILSVLAVFIVCTLIDMALRKVMSSFFNKLKTS